MNKKRYTKLLACLLLSIALVGTSFATSWATNQDSTKNDFGSANLDTHADDGVLGILGQDDFDTVQEYMDYIKKHPELSGNIGSKATPNSTSSVAATLRYNITGLSTNRVIQKVYIGTTYIYVVQRYGTYGDHTRLSRCLINATGDGATYQDHMILTNFGHGQTLEWYEHNNQAYFWIACKANTAYTKKWALQIGRVKYEPPVNGVVVQKDYTDICRFASINMANPSGTSFGTLKRVDAALSSDRSKILFWAMDTSSDEEIQYSYYDTAALNTILDGKENAASKYVLCSDNAVRAACQFSFRQSGSNRVLPNGSCQGLEFNNAQSIFVAGGLSGVRPKIGKMVKSGSSYTYTKEVTISNSGLSGGDVEIEGLQLKGDDVYFGIAWATPSHHTRVYSIPKTAF